MHPTPNWTEGGMTRRHDSSTPWMGEHDLSVSDIHDKSKPGMPGLSTAVGTATLTCMLSIPELRRELHTSVIGARILHYPSVGSTNDVARTLATLGAREGIVVLANEQKAGRGRGARSWIAPPGTALLFSLLLRPPLAPDHWQRLTMACSLALAESTECQTGLAVSLKWPNDLLIGDRKVAGVLTELRTAHGRLEYAVVGIGLNANIDFSDPHMASLASQATSLLRELGSPVAREPLMARILERVEGRYLALCSGWSPQQLWTARLATLGQRVVVSGAHCLVEGYAEGVDPDGALLVRLEDGHVARILAGDVSLRPKSMQPCAT